MKTESAKTTVRKSGNSVVVRLPLHFRIPLGNAIISSVGDSLVIHPEKSDRTAHFIESLKNLPDGLFDTMEEPEDKFPEPLDTW